MPTQINERNKDEVVETIRGQLDKLILSSKELSFDDFANLKNFIKTQWTDGNGEQLTDIAVAHYLRLAMYKSSDFHLWVMSIMSCKSDEIFDYFKSLGILEKNTEVALIKFLNELEILTTHNEIEAIAAKEALAEYGQKFSSLYAGMDKNKVFDVEKTDTSSEKSDPLKAILDDLVRRPASEDPKSALDAMLKGLAKNGMER